MDRRADAALQSTANLTHDAEQERTADATMTTSWTRATRAEVNAMVRTRSREHHQDNDEREKSVREVAVHATVLKFSRETAPPTYRGDEGW